MVGEVGDVATMVAVPSRWEGPRGKDEDAIDVCATRMGGELLR